jgi:hypothetical protein
VEKVIAVGEGPGAFDAKSAMASLMMAEAELAAPQTQGDRVVRRLAEAAEILDVGAQEAEAAGDFDAPIVKASAVAAALCRITQEMWGG